MFGLRGGIVVDRNAHAGMAMRGTISTKASSAQNVISSGVYIREDDDMDDRERWWSAIILFFERLEGQINEGGREGAGEKVLKKHIRIYVDLRRIPKFYLSTL